MAAVAKAKRPLVEEKKSLKVTMGELQRKYGAAAIGFGSGVEVIKVSTGIPSLDFALLGGLPLGRVYHIFGKYRSGKTFTASSVSAEFQRAYPEKMVGWVNLEKSFDPNRARQVGIDLDRLIVIDPSTAEEGFDAALALVKDVSLLVVDSIGALSAKVETESEMGESTMGMGPRVLNKFLRKWLSQSTTKEVGGFVPSLLLLNQVRDRIGVYKAQPGPPGGHGLRHFASVNLEISRGEYVTLKENDDSDEPIIIGHDVKFRVDKNNTACSDKRGSFLLATRPYDLGAYAVGANEVDWAADILRYGVYYGVIAKAGGHHTFGSIKLGASKLESQGFIHKDLVVAALLRKRILAEVLKKHGAYTGEAEKVAKSGKVSGIKVKRKNNVG